MPSSPHRHDAKGFVPFGPLGPNDGDKPAVQVADAQPSLLESPTGRHGYYCSAVEQKRSIDEVEAAFA
jgi:hypothetical protein